MSSPIFPRFFLAIVFTWISGAPCAGASPPSDGCFRDKGDFGVPLTEQKAAAASFWQYQWQGAPYNSDPMNKAGVLQVVNGGSQPMWIRYSGIGIGLGQPWDWKQYIVKASGLNGNQAHAWNQLGDNGMGGQGDGFKLNPGEYQIVPFAGIASWLAGSLGCGQYGQGCKVAPGGRGGGENWTAVGQPSTLFEWTAPGVMDVSIVDGFGIPMRVERDGQDSDCQDEEGNIYYSLHPSLCSNKIIDPSDGTYVGCSSMCGCQSQAINLGTDTNPACAGMAPRSKIENYPHSPGGYCGCSQGDCVQALRDLFAQDPAGQAYCNSVTTMAHNTKGERIVYCNAYDDIKGTRSEGNGVVKVTLCNSGFENITDHQKSQLVI